MTSNKLLDILSEILCSSSLKKDERIMSFARKLSSSMLKLSQDEIKNVLDKLNTIPDSARSEIFNGIVYALTKQVASKEDFIRLAFNAGEIERAFWGIVVAMEINKPEYSNIKKVIFPVNSQFLTLATPENIRDFFSSYDVMNKPSSGKAEKLTEKMGFDPADARSKKIVESSLQGIYNILTGEITDEELRRREEESKRIFQSSYDMARQFSVNMGILPRWENLLRIAHTKVKDTVFANFFRNTSSLKNFDIPGVEYFAAITTILFAMVDIIRIDKEGSYESSFKKTINQLAQLTRMKFKIEWSSLKSLRPIVLQEAKFEIERPVQKEISQEQFDIAFYRGVEQGKKLFEPYKRGVSNIDDITNRTIAPIINNFNQEFSIQIVKNGNKFGLTEDDILKFVESCYIVVSLVAINSRDDQRMSECLRIMTSIFSQWKSLSSIGYLSKKMGMGEYYLDSKKATEIYKILYPQITNNIINAIPREQIQYLSEFINDLKNGKLTNVYEFSRKYADLIGIIDSSKMVRAEYVLNQIANRDPWSAARLILQRIAGESHFLQNAVYPDNVEELKKKKTIEDLNREMENPQDEQKDDSQPEKNLPNQNKENLEIWIDPEIIKMSGAFLFQLLQIINKSKGY